MGFDLQVLLAHDRWIAGWAQECGCCWGCWQRRDVAACRLVVRAWS